MLYEIPQHDFRGIKHKFHQSSKRQETDWPAQIYHITPRRVQQILKEHNKAGEIPVGRGKKPVLKSVEYGNYFAKV